MSNLTDADKAKKAAEETARKDAEAKEKADAKAKRDAELKADGDKKAAEEAAKRSMKAAQPAPTHAAPYPTQADLDAMKDGSFRHGRESKADGNGVGYKTR